MTEIINLAFAEDPTWSPILVADGDLETAYKYWHLFVNSAARYPWSFTNDEASAAAVWYPPGATELNATEEASFHGFAQDLLGPAKSAELFKTLEQFEKATPDGDYFYLSLLAVHPQHAGKGLGMQLLRENLKEFDELNSPTYLESSNPKNDGKYESLGYQKHGEMLLPSGLTISTFWREPGSE